VASEHHHLELQKQTKTQQTEVTAPQLPSRKKKETSEQLTMISAKRIAHLAKKWQRMAAQGMAEDPMFVGTFAGAPAFSSSSQVSYIYSRSGGLWS
jgi:shikimate kinase